MSTSSTQAKKLKFESLNCILFFYQIYYEIYKVYEIIDQLYFQIVLPI